MRDGKVFCGLVAMKSIIEAKTGRNDTETAVLGTERRP